MVPIQAIEIRRGLGISQNDTGSYQFAEYLADTAIADPLPSHGSHLSPAHGRIGAGKDPQYGPTDGRK